MLPKCLLRVLPLSLTSHLGSNFFSSSAYSSVEEVSAQTRECLSRTFELLDLLSQARLPVGN